MTIPPVNIFTWNLGEYVLLLVVELGTKILVRHWGVLGEVAVQVISLVYILSRLSIYSVVLLVLFNSELNFSSLLVSCLSGSIIILGEISASLWLWNLFRIIFLFRLGGVLIDLVEEPWVFILVLFLYVYQRFNFLDLMIKFSRELIKYQGQAL